MVDKAKRMALRHKLAAGGRADDHHGRRAVRDRGSTNVIHVVRLVGDELDDYGVS